MGGAATAPRAKGSPGEDAIRMLTNDHRTVDGLLARARSDASVIEEIRNELEVHARLEEEIFYPAVRQALKDRQMVDEALHEHNEVREAVDELAAMDQDDEDYVAKLDDLKDKVQHHVKEEEGEMFPQAREVLTQEQLTQLGTQMRSRKGQLKNELVEA